MRNEIRSRAVLVKLIIKLKVKDNEELISHCDSGIQVIFHSKGKSSYVEQKNKVPEIFLLK